MGRPIKSVSFGNRNADGSKAGGSGIANVTIVTPGSGYFAANATVTFAAPYLVGGVQATGLPVLFGNGAISSVTITNSGSGYYSGQLPSVTVGGANSIAANIIVTSSNLSTRQAGMLPVAFIPVANGGSSAINADILQQKGTKRYRVLTTQGTGICSLVDNGSPAAGQMYIQAFDSAGGTYYVKRFDEHVATLTPNTGTQFVAGQKVRWTLGTAVINVSVKINNI